VLVIVVLLVKKAVIGKRLAHVVRKAQIMGLIHVESVVVITQAVRTVQEYLVLMLIWIIAVYVMIFQKMTVYKTVQVHGVVVL
jgi:hypothetical protein